MNKSKGFTLIELMIVVAIIGILSAIAIPKFADLIRKSNEGATKGNLGAIRSAISIYYGEMEGYFPSPADTDGTAALGNVMVMDNGKYLKEMPASNCPPYHTKTSAVCLAVATADETTATNGGLWGYRNENVTTGGGKSWGDLWVNCTHTDSKSTGWGTY